MWAIFPGKEAEFYSQVNDISTCVPWTAWIRERRKQGVGVTQSAVCVLPGASA